jgi:hypothetical protein
MTSLALEGRDVVGASGGGSVAVTVVEGAVVAVAGCSVGAQRPRTCKRSPKRKAIPEG